MHGHGCGTATSRPAKTALRTLWILVGLGCDEPNSVDWHTTPETRPNVVVIGLDTLRADHLGVYGSTTARTPHLDAFADEAILFESCSSPSTWTLPAFASLFSGRLPYDHGAIGGSHPSMRRSVDSLAEILQREGYATHAFVAVDYLTRAFRLDQGFDCVSRFVSGPTSTRSQLYQPAVLAHLRAPHERRQLLFVHYYDAHSPWLPPEPYDRMYYDGDERSPDNASLARIYDTRVNRFWPNPEIYDWMKEFTDIAFPVAQYKAAVTSLDATVGELFRALRETGWLDRSIVVVTADHGEHLTEHDSYFYHRFPYRENLHVPLMIRLPGGLAGGRRIAGDVSLIDVLPTLLDLLAIDAKPYADAQSLADVLLNGGAVPARLHFAEFGASEERWAKAVWDGRFRLIEFRHFASTWTELYDRRADPLETKNLAAALPAEHERLLGELRRRFPPERRLRARRPGRAEPIPGDVRERLRALGYSDS